SAVVARVSPEWELWYADHDDIGGRHPFFEKLVGLHVSEAERLLELGCGVGLNIPFLRRTFGQYHGIEGSAKAVEYVHRSHPDLAEYVRCADFCREIPFEPGFDAVVDRASVAHNDLASIVSCVNLV